MKVPSIGKPAPGFVATLADGSTTGPRDHLGHPLLLIFLRHLA
jgi:hypothetical protein